MNRLINLYFVASPLQYLAARVIAEQIESGNKQILIWYKPGVQSIVVKEDWDAVAYMPWPRWEPLPGMFGRHRRLVQNIENISNLVGKCETVQIHSAVFDTEAVNYFLKALKSRNNAKKVLGRILPDGLISIRRYPLTPFKCSLQWIRKVRTLANPRLNYCCFSGDRIGSDASFCDRIYVVSGLPHEYPAEKIVTLPPLVKKAVTGQRPLQKKALVVGQPLAGAGLISKSSLDDITRQIYEWLQTEKFDAVDYKAHPKDPNLELCCNEYEVLNLEEPLEVWMSKTHYDAVVGVRSSALLFARQIYSSDTPVVSFGWEKIQFKSKVEASDMRMAFVKSNIRIA